MNTYIHTYNNLLNNIKKLNRLKKPVLEYGKNILALALCV